MNEISFPAIIVNSGEKGIAKLWIDEPYVEIVRAHAIAHKIKPGTKIRIVMMEWEDSCSERAFNLFHALRDRLAGTDDQIDITNQYKEDLKLSLKLDFGVRKELAPGIYWLKSTKRMTVSEMWRLTEGTITRCLEEKAPIDDLLQESKDLKAEQEAIENAKKQGTDNGRVPDGEPAPPAESVR